MPAFFVATMLSSQFCRTFSQPILATHSRGPFLQLILTAQSIFLFALAYFSALAYSVALPHSQTDNPIKF